MSQTGTTIEQSKWQKALKEAEKEKEENPSAFSFNKPKAVMYFGQKDKSMQCCYLYYTPTKKHINNIKEMFGWDVEIIKEE